MGWLAREVEKAIENTLRDIRDAFLEFLQDLIEMLLGPIVGTPAPRGDDYIAFGTPINEPWASLYKDVYLPFILPLSAGLLFIGLAYIGTRAGSISEYQRKILLRRIGIAFLGLFFWFPVASMGTQFFNAIGMTLAPTADMTSDLTNVIKSGVGGLIIALVMYFVTNIFLILAAAIYALRWVLIYVLTLSMPLLGALWAVEVWPLTQFSEISKKAAAIYPGLLMAGIPAALLFRIGWEADFTFNVGGLLAVFLGVILIPAACIASIATVLWSSPRVQSFSRRAMYMSAGYGMTGRALRGRSTYGPGNGGDGGATTSVRRGLGETTRGARNVHRGLSAQSAGAVGPGGQTTLGSGSSRAYKAGSMARRGAESGREFAARYNRMRQTKTGRMRDLAKYDAKRGGRAAKARAKQSLKKTMEKVRGGKR
jgi:hypothetical protein